ncbi:MAG: hypothetical protein LBE98_00540 [Puniceicoccales bacterium]|jgi:hypothetical protein|nr:hypothetical protein [Puniceicoccales bacterium]
MDSLSQKKKIENLRNEAQSKGIAVSKTIMINGHKCTVTATPIGIWAFQGTNIKIEYTSLGRRTCAADFTYNKGQVVTQKLQSFSDQVNEAVQQLAAETARQQEFSTFFSEIASHVQPMSIDDMSSRAPGICRLLGNVKSFVQQNDLTKDKVLNLKLMLRTLCSTPIIGLFG